MHLLQVLDPVEEMFPYRGPSRIPRSGVGRNMAERKGRRASPRISSRLEARRALSAASPEPRASSFAVHHTDRRPRKVFSSCRAASSGDPSFASVRATAASANGFRPHDRLARVSSPLAVGGSRRAAADLADPAADAAAPETGGVSADSALLVDLQDRERTPARTPWWLTLIRLLLVTLVILALAEPVLRPEAKFDGGERTPARAPRQWLGLRTGFFPTHRRSRKCNQ